MQLLIQIISQPCLKQKAALRNAHAAISHCQWHTYWALAITLVLRSSAASQLLPFLCALQPTPKNQQLQVLAHARSSLTANNEAI